MISIQKQKKLPDTPGVYFFKNASRDVLYIGKATSLRDRVRSYNSRDLFESRSPLIVKMVNEAVRVDFQKTDSVLEALILEANLIKKYQPAYNTAEKDDKSFNYVVITKEEFPRVLTVRGRELEMKMRKNESIKSGDQGGFTQNTEKIQDFFGPFTQGASLREALKIVRKIFPFRDKCIPNSGKPCFNRQIGLCPGVCSGGITSKEYHATIKHIKLFFEGKKKELIKSLKKEMNMLAKEREFEKAAEKKRTIFALQHIQDIALIKANKSSELKSQISGQIDRKEKIFRIEAFDIAHMSGKNVVGVMVVVEDGELRRDEYRKFKIRKDPGVNDTAALKEVLERRLNHKEWPFPQIIVVDGAKAQINVASAVLKERDLILNSARNTPRSLDRVVNIVSVVKDEKHRPREILGKQPLITDYESDILLANSEAHRFAIAYHRNVRGKLL